MYKVRRRRRRPQGAKVPGDDRVGRDEGPDASCTLPFDLVQLNADGKERTPEENPENNSNDNSSADAHDGSSLSNYSDPPTHMYVRIDQVLRRHHTNQGRFESWIEIHQSEPPMAEQDGEGDDLRPSCQLSYRQVFPEFVTPMWRTLEIVDGNRKDGSDSSSSNSDNNMNRISPLVKATVEWKPDDRSSILHVTATAGGGGLEQPKTLPSALVISLEYSPTFLTLDDFPGDPNRGRELPPALLTVHCHPRIVEGGKRLTDYDGIRLSVYSNSLLLLPPVPDMSMPFNVISLTSSLYAYIVGTLITILVRKASEKIKYKLHPDRRPPSKLKQLKEKFRAKVVARFRRRGKHGNDEADGRNDEEGKIGRDTAAGDVVADPPTARTTDDGGKND